MTITNIQYTLDFDGSNNGIQATMDGQEVLVPLDLANRHYVEIISATAEDNSIWGDTVPEPMATLAVEYLFAQQLTSYTTATARLAQYIVADGRAEVTEMQDGPNQLTDSDGQPQFDSDGSPIYEQVEVITVTAIDPVAATVDQTNYNSDDVPYTVQVENPLITKDNEERAAAQATIDATPQPVIDEYNS
jgi:hypothetical protein